MQITLDLEVPELALSPEAGLYLGNNRIAAITKHGLVRISAALPASQGELITLTLRCKGWIPKEHVPGSQDARELGVMGYAITLKARGTRAPLVDVGG